MLEFYPQIKAVHIAAVLASGLLFALRGLLVLTGNRLAMVAPVRFTSYAIDTVLLTAALMLVTILPRAMFANGWLTAKLVLLVIYVGLGSFALKRGRSRRIRALCYGAAISVYAFMIGIAWFHHPLGILFGWGWLSGGA